MSWTQRGLYAALIGLAGLIVMSRVSSGKKAGLSPASSPIKGAVYASAIPIYPGAKLTDIMGGNYYNELGGAVTFTSQSWFFETGDDAAKVVEFYRQKLPPGYQAKESEPGTVSLEWIPPGAAEGELVNVYISPGSFHIGETIKAKDKR